MYTRSPFRVVVAIVAIGAVLLPAVHAENPKAAKVSPTYIDDDATLEYFTEKLGTLIAKGKCISPNDVKKKTETDHPFALKTTAPGTTALAPEEVYKKLLSSVYIIGCVKKTDDAEEYEDGWFATAWALTDDGVLMTNWHVFEKADRAYFGVANAKGDVFPMIGSGTTALDTAIGNLFVAGQRLAVVVNGYFGERLMQIAAAHGIETTPTTGYHETLTLFWIRCVREHLAEHTCDTPLVALANGLVARYDKNTPLKHYTRERLFSPAARADWVEPDIAQKEEGVICYNA